MGVHDGHRSRLKHRYLDHGMDSMEDHVVLELLLTYALARGDVNPLAHDLIEHFGSLDAVLDASVADLQTVPGVGEHTAILLHMIPDLSRRYSLSRQSETVCLDSTAKAGKYVVPLFQNMKDERVYMICLDARCKILSVRLITEGDVNSAGLSLRKLAENALQAKATLVILAHNHPAGSLSPSKEDLETTARAREALRAVEITLADHIIVAGSNYLSLADDGYFT